MRVLIIGYGKMGKEVEHYLSESKHEISGIIDENTDRETELSETDVAIEFTGPGSVVSNLLWCFKKKIPVVTGSTGWLEHLPFITKECHKQNGSLLWASNFSIGMNIFFKLNTELSRIMKHFQQYTPSVNETHHIHKLDKPSGTAITLADEIIQILPEKIKWIVDSIDPASYELPVKTRREGDVKGIHEVLFESDQDIISIRHEAKSRQGFAMGAVMAAQWLTNKKGVYNFKDIFNEVMI